MYIKDVVNVFILVYVDDTLITWNCVSVINSFKKILHDKLKIIDLGILHYFLSIKVVPTSNGVCFNQRKYTVKLIFEFGLSASKPAMIPMDQGSKLNDVVYDKYPYLANIDVYQRLVEKLVYLTMTRPDNFCRSCSKSIHACSYAIPFYCCIEKVIHLVE